MSLTDMLNQLKFEYISGLPGKISNIKDLLDAEDLIALRTEFHKLKGNGKTYGLPEISELASIVEAHCLEKPETAMAEVKVGLDVLEDIKVSRETSEEYSLATDTRFVELRARLSS